MKIENEQKFHRYSISVHDFERSAQFLEEAINYNKIDLIYESLLISSVIFYCRPFTDNERSDDAVASRKIMIGSFVALSVQEESLHGKLMKLRNKAIAHSEWIKNPTKINHKNSVVSSRFFNILNENINLDDFFLLVNKLCEQCHNKRADFLLNPPR